MENEKQIVTRVITKPARKVIMKRGAAAKDYFSYCAEVGCDVWEVLRGICPPGEEPVCMWLPEPYRRPGTSTYVQGVEVPLNFDERAVPQGMELIQLPQTKYLQFQGQPFKEENYSQAIEEVWAAIKGYDPAVIGCRWDNSQPRIQLEPVGARGYMELLPIMENK